MTSGSAPIPALPPPQGQSSNFGNPESLLQWEIICITVCLIVTTIVVVLRTYVRLIMKKQWILEDYMCCFSYIGLIVFSVLTTITMKHRGGVHEWDLISSQVNDIIFWFNVTSIEYAPNILCTKLTVLLLYRRVFLPQRGSLFDIVVRLFMLIISIYYITTIFVKIWECNPRPRIWDKSVEGTCLDVSSILNVDGVFNTISDILIILVPVKQTWKLQMKRGKKVGIIILFTVGLIAPIFSTVGWVVRLHNSANPDVAYNQPQILLWGAAELSTGIICTCLPSLPVLWRHRRPSPRFTASQSNFKPRHAGPFARKQPTSLTDHDPFNSEYLELGETVSNPGVIEELPTAVITNIKGGITSHKLQGIEPMVSGERGDIPVHGPVIVKVIDMKQSCV